MRYLQPLLFAACAFALAGCANLAGLQQAYTTATSTTVPPSTIIVAANAFDGLKATATQYLVYCKANLSTAICAPSNRRAVIKYVRAGTAARNQLEASVASNTPALSSIYNVLIAAVNGLKATPAATFGG